VIYGEEKKMQPATMAIGFSIVPLDDELMLQTL
jgi:hypothetical protein